MGSRAELKTKLVTILSEVTGNPDLAPDMPDSTDLINEIGLDSIQMINFILMIEDEIGIEIDFENFHADTLKSLKVLCEYVENLSSKSQVAV